MTLTTCVTLSAEPFTFDTPRHIRYLNYVSQFDGAEGLHKSKLDSIFQVKTKYFFWNDYDDPLPNIYPVPERSIVFGDFCYTELPSKVSKKIPVPKWTDTWHLSNPVLVHKAICNTAMARAVANLLPQGEYFTETLLYYFMCKVYGYTYNPGLEMFWNKHVKGLHTKSSQSLTNSVTWIRENRDSVIARLPRE